MTGASEVRRFRTRTSHAPGRPAAGGPFDPANRPDLVKRYRAGPVVQLPTDWREASVSMATALSGRRARDTRPMRVRELARLLFLTGGVTRSIRRGGQVRRFRAAPSAGALYPIEVYVVSGGSGDLAAGVHHHDPVAATLRELRQGDVRDHLARAVVDPAAASSPVSLVFTGIPWRTAWKYGPRGYRHLFWDAGAMIANTLVAAASAGWRASLLTGFVDRMVSELVGLDGQPFRELPLAVVRLGGPGCEDGDVDPRDPPPPGTELPPVDVRVEPLSPDTRSYDEIAEVHTAAELDAPDDVTAWRGERPAEVFPATCVPGEVPDAVEGTVDEVVLRRGSTRRFDPDAGVPAESVRWALRVASTEVPGDLAPPGRLPVRAVVAAHAVEGTPAGLYLAGCDSWERTGDQDRGQTAHQCLDQRLGATSAATVFWGCDLDRLLDAAGARSYRTAELAAGIAAERLQLAAFATGVGGTGLTFYDDEVLRATGLDPLLVTAVGQPDYEPTPGRRPGSESR